MRGTQLTLGAGTHMGQTCWGYFRWHGWKEANNSALSQAARTQKCLHTQRRWDYFGKSASLLFCFMGQRGGSGGGEGGACCFLALSCDTPALLCLWERKQQSDQYILCVDFQQSVTCVRGNELVRGYSACYGFDMNLAPGSSERDECII